MVDMERSKRIAGERAYFNSSSGEPVAKRIDPGVEAGIGQPFHAAPVGEKPGLFRGWNLKALGHAVEIILGHRIASKIRRR